MKVQIKRIKKDIEIINSFNATPERGITRLTFSKEYGEARSYIVDELKRIGADVSTTLGGNLRGRLAGSEKGTPSVMMGSHIDSVVQGGRFDGVAGVVSALEAARVIKEKSIPHRHPIDVVVFAEEEGSRFGSVMIGSRAWIGKLSLKDLGQTKDKDGIRYFEAMDQCGIVCEDFSTLKAEQVKAMVELHIEQSVVLEKRGLQIGLVEGIAGIKQSIVTIHGIPNHAGGTPMGLRYDALQGAVRIIGAAEEIAREMREPTVATTGFISCEPGQVNVIPGRVQFTLDIRDTDSKRLEEAVKTIMAVTEKTCQERGLTNDIKPRSDTPPVALSKKVVQLIENVARERKIEPLRMMSGALHDSSILAEITDVGMIFVPSKEGKSHSPDEFTDLKDIEVGADILLHTVVKLAS
jgi:allantoate deiminase